MVAGSKELWDKERDRERKTFPALHFEGRQNDTEQKQLLALHLTVTELTAMQQTLIFTLKWTIRLHTKDCYTLLKTKQRQINS